MPRKGEKLRRTKAKCNQINPKLLAQIKQVLDKQEFIKFNHITKLSKSFKLSNADGLFYQNVIQPLLQLFDDWKRRHFLKELVTCIPSQFREFYHLKHKLMTIRASKRTYTSNNKKTNIKASFDGNVFWVHVKIMDVDNKSIEFEGIFNQSNFPNDDLCDVANAYIAAIDKKDGLFNYRYPVGSKLYAYIEGQLDKIPIITISMNNNPNHATNEQFTAFKFDIKQHGTYCFSMPNQNEQKFDRLIDCMNQFESMKMTTQFFSQGGNSVLHTFHHIEKNFEYDKFCILLLKDLNETLHGKYKIYARDENKRGRPPWMAISGVAVHHMPTYSVLQKDGSFSYGRRVCTEKLIRDTSTIPAESRDVMQIISNSVIVSLGKWRWSGSTEVQEGLRVSYYKENQHLFKKYLPLDYRSIEWKLRPLDAKWSLFYDFRDKESLVHFTPRMAYKFFILGWILINELKTKWSEHLDEFPDCCHRYLNKPMWKNAFISSIDRVLIRLVTGMGVACNCTAEEMVVHMILNRVGNDEYDDIFDADEFMHDVGSELLSLPDYGQKDENWQSVLEGELVDDDVLMLFDEELAPTVLNPKSSLCRKTDILNFHPSTWYLAFRDDDFYIESIQKPVNEATIWYDFLKRYRHLRLYTLSTPHISIIDYRNFVEHLWNPLGVGSSRKQPPFHFFDRNLYPMISIVLDRKSKVIDHNILDQLAVLVKEVNQGNVIYAHKLLMILLIIYKMGREKQYFLYLFEEHNLLKYLIDVYYDCLFVQNDANLRFLLKFYCIIISIMAKNIFRQNHDYLKCPNKEENDYLRSCLNDVFVKILQNENIRLPQHPQLNVYFPQKLNINSLDLRAPITSFLNRRVGIWNNRRLKRMGNNVLKNIKCFHSPCVVTRSIREMKMCKKCKVARYCSRRCQKIDWKLAHHQNCI